VKTALVVVLDLRPLRLHLLIEINHVIADADEPAAANQQDENQRSEATKQTESTHWVSFFLSQWIDRSGSVISDQ
ncbi:MAG: hypothetical protein ACRD3J_30880, partial [Thermoanaerobaculia bacterium]